MANNIKKPRGTADSLPSDTKVLSYIENQIRNICRKSGYGEIRFPMFEYTELFSRGVGDSTDIVQKEMYTFEDRDGRSMTLRPEGTAAVARLILENGLYAGALPLKYFYIGSFFRYEKPQTGRSREFTQFGAELYGADGAVADASVIMLADNLFKSLDIKNYTLNINSIGCADCRPEYRRVLSDYFKENEEGLCDTCKKRLVSNPLRILDCKNDTCRKIAAGAPRTLDHLCDKCKGSFDELAAYLDYNGVGYIIDDKIVRGLDYYTGVVFEFIKEDIGAQSTLGGGGRYNGLFEEIGGPPTPAVGFALGMSRIILAMETDGVLPESPGGSGIYIASLGNEEKKYALKLSEELKRAGLAAESDLIGRSLKAQMKYADKAGFDYVIVLGSEEISTGKCMLQDMKNGIKLECSLNCMDIANIINREQQ